MQVSILSYALYLRLDRKAGVLRGDRGATTGEKQLTVTTSPTNRHWSHRDFLNELPHQLLNMQASELTFSVSVLVPLMLLVALELASVARDIELEKHHPSIQSPYQSDFEQVILSKLSLLPFLKNTSRPIPQFGHFGTIHALNSSLLLTGIAFVNYSVGGPADYFLSFAMVLFLSMLPYLEIDEYAEIRRNGVPTRSIVFHVVPSFTMGALVAGGARSVRLGVPLWFFLAVGMLILVPLYSLSQIYFSDRLASEIKEGILNQ